MPSFLFLVLVDKTIHRPVTFKESGPVTNGIPRGQFGSLNLNVLTAVPALGKTATALTLRELQGYAKVLIDFQGR